MRFTARTVAILALLPFFAVIQVHALEDVHAIEDEPTSTGGGSRGLGTYGSTMGRSLSNPNPNQFRFESSSTLTQAIWEYNGCPTRTGIAFVQPCNPSGVETRYGCVKPGRVAEYVRNDTHLGEYSTSFC